MGVDGLLELDNSGSRNGQISVLDQVVALKGCGDCVGSIHVENECDSIPDGDVHSVEHEGSVIFGLHIEGNSVPLSCGRGIFHKRDAGMSR